jgi:hypothetical protein
MPAPTGTDAGALGGVGSFLFTGIGVEGLAAGQGGQAGDHHDE